MPSPSPIEIERQVADALRQGSRLHGYARDGQRLEIEQLPRALSIPACFQLRIGIRRLVRREVFVAAEAAAARVLALSTPALVQVSLAALAAS